MTTIIIDRAVVEQALETFRMCVPMDGRHAEVDAAFRNLRAALAQQAEQKESPWRCACGANLYIDENGAPRSKA